ncbi:MAG: hypothetical protein J6S67_25635 [Methanobrevibacter sp.]|nr:hypothetical protein [Methanobrevibacter sp.]
MRKIIRNILRYNAKKEETKASAYINYNFGKIQEKKYGETRRLLNQVKSTHKKNTWGNRCGGVMNTKPDKVEKR